MRDPGAQSIAERLSHVLALLSHAVLAVLFFAPLVKVHAFGGFAFEAGLYILLWEFVALHAGIMISHVHTKSFTGGRSTILFMAFVYATFAFSIAAFAGTILLLPFFAATLAPKFIGAFTGHWNATSDERRDWIIAMALYCGAMVLPIILPLPLPSIPVQNPDPNASGLWVERPETLLFTGFAYFAGLFLLDLRDIFRRAKTPAVPIGTTSVE